MKIKQPAFAAVDTTTKPPHICAWTICGSPKLVREKIGKVWDSNDPKSGWTEAKADGIRVLKITLRADHQ